MTKHFSNLPIGIKIGLGLVLVFVVFGIQAFSSYNSIRTTSNAFKEFETLSRNTVSVLVIDKNISEIQKTALAYGQTGSSSIIQKMNETHEMISKRLSDVLEKTSDQDRRQLLEHMIVLLNSYGNNIKALKRSYEYRSNMIENEIPKSLEEGMLSIEQLSNSLSNRPSPPNHRILANELRLAWLEIEIATYHFINERKYEERKKVKQLVPKMKDMISRLKLKSLDRQELSELEKIGATIDQFIGVFDRAVQSNRLYLSLLNVVMAGQAHEFAQLVERLRYETIAQLEDIASKGDERVTESRQVLLASLLISLLLLGMIAYYYEVSISRAINAIVGTFRRLLEGDFEALVPGAERQDEIGQLARAASAYMEMSKKFEDAKVKAEESEKLKSEFLANMSHEIRTPLNGILGMVSLLQDSEVSDKQKHMLDTIDTCGDNLLCLLNDILDLSKIEAGQVDFEQRSFNLQDLLKRLEGLFSNLADRKGLKLTCEFKSPDGLEFVIGDEVRLQQVLSNLLSNAIKFTDSGEVKVVIESRKLDRESYMLDFKVSDTGIGIDTKSREALFEAFSQADSSITRRYGGTGLGLTICSKIVFLLGGVIQVESQLGRGSCFSFSIRLSRGEALSHNAKKVVDYEFQRNLTVLIVDDNGVNIELAHLLLEKMGHNVIEAYQGLQAVEILEDQNLWVDVVLMDIQMPIMDGVQATTTIKGMPHRKDIPILAMTANVLAEDRERYQKAGMEGLISKPIRKRDLQKAFSELAENQRLPEPPEENKRSA
ncbi:ATP-binding protein [Pseudobacteriovorax antillogorgiicola]|uniref:ATP-binding protein n=1 Tax=Pseudobacteriovorax antillogorgiicola TaxID=1513793 RepID=UPI001A9D794D|nr:ATP-binding protein [Pseudobacteriovorax antillogorgiicola]